MLIAYLILFSGVACAGIGGELFVRGSVGLAKWIRISPGIIGATVAAFATSSPELSVAIRSSMEGQPQISLGDALGSNVVNVALILGIALVVSGIKVSRDAIKRDYPVALAVPVITMALFSDGQLSRGEGIILLGLFIVWMTLTILEARKQRSAAARILTSGGIWKAVGACLFGLIFLGAAGGLIVSGARSIAHSYGLHEFIIGATIVAVGTSVPELATTIVSKIRGHDDVGLGTVLGSNIFNGLFIVAVAAVICPIRLESRDVALACGFGILALAAAFPYRKGFITRQQGAILILLYVVYIAAVLFQGPAR